ncbi:MAG: HAD family hydrolase [Pseudomonadota bacterium]|nr:HAD family hydrolase [Pseudomonadota bacterium]
MIDFSKIKAISLDLDDTLWPVWPTIGRAEETLAQWLAEKAPLTVPLCAIPGYQRQIREEMPALRPDLGNDLSALRREAIRVLLKRAGEDPNLAEPAFEVFFEARQKVVFFDDALPALQFLNAKFPMVALSNGNADIQKVGLAAYFKAAFNPINLGVGKPDPQMFHAGAQALGVLPDEVLHIGDDPHLDVLAAQRAGLQAVWVNREEKPWTHDVHPAPFTVISLKALCESWPV